MLSLRWHGKKDVRIDEIEITKLRPGWVRVKNVWAGICGSGKSSSSRMYWIEWMGEILILDADVCKTY
jgi:Zn-dependent alcohol dehydrogenase